MNRGPFRLLPLVALLLLPLAGATGAHYVPHVGDRFSYAEDITLTNGTGNYTGYTENGDYAGSLTVTAVQPNGTEWASYQSSGTWSNNQGQSKPWSENGNFSFSANSFLYVQGTDNQTGYTNPHVWFFMDDTLTVGGTFYALSTPMSVVSTGHAYPLSSSSTGYVKTIFAEGNGSYQRNDAYGVFTATYTWKEYFDPATGYIVGYRYVETDTDSAGDGFTWTDSLSDTSTSFPLTAAAAPPAPSPGASFDWTPVILLVVLLVIVLVVVALVLRARHRKGSMPSQLPRHPTEGGTGPVAPYRAPAPIDLIPKDQPAIQQVVVKETVKVPCRFCGTLVDSTDTVCPKCGAPRT